MVETGPRNCRKCQKSYQPSETDQKYGNYTCRECRNNYQREYARKKYKEHKLSATHPDRVMGKHSKNAVIPKNVDLPSDAKVEEMRLIMAKYGLEIDESALVAARAVKAGFPVKNLSGILGRDYLLYCVMSDMMNVKHAALRMKYLEMAGQLTGVIGAAAAPGGVQITQVQFNDIGIKPGNGTSLAGRKPSAVLEAEAVQPS